MTASGDATPVDDLLPDYVLDEQIGFILRQVTQRHVAIFTERVADRTTPTQFAAISKLRQLGPCSQNRLGRLTAMDAATIKGVVDRLTRRGLTKTRPDPDDARLLTISLTEAGEAAADRTIAVAREVTRLTLDPLTADEQAQLLRLLRKLR